jgi:hypothetical protein
MSRAAAARPSARVAIAAPIRREADGLLEWIAYHRALGVGQFILGDNGGDDGTSELLVALDRAGIIQRLDFVGRTYFQTAFNAAALAAARSVADFLLFMDADEFLRLDDPVKNGFDAAWYFDAYPDVRASGFEPREHFLIHGWREGRDPNAVFKTRYYVDANPDVARANIDPLQHYEQHGWHERRDPAPDFSTAAWLAAHPELGGSGICPMDHYLETVAGRRPLSLDDLIAGWFADPDTGAVGLNWAIHGSSGALRRENRLVLERFPFRAPRDFSTNNHIKTIVRVAACARMANPHAAALRHNPRMFWRRSYDYRAADGTLIEWEGADAGPTSRGISKNVCWAGARVDHFVLKSREEFEAKRARGSASSPRTEAQRAMDGYFNHHDRNDFHDPVPTARVEATKRGMAEIAAALAAASPIPT